MNFTNISWKNDRRKVPKDSHALFGASKYQWLRYDVDKMIQVYSSVDAKRIGTELHEAAALLIKNKVKMPEDPKTTLNMYVNDCIYYSMRPEELLYYSDIFFGTADAIGIREGVLRIFDLKTGRTKAHMDQLKIYASFFLLIYDLIPSNFEDIELRIYQNNDIQIEHPTEEDIVPIMDKIVTVDQIIKQMKENR